ncbi:MAG TPA: chemotaxis protein CheD [Firmicutes bacterium]|jgi:chemotaxis protein CheD|nr:chemotaxis protein CheD [Bacillota bacterium]
MDNDIIKVKIADLAVKREPGIIVTIGLGSCVGIALYDPVNRIGGLAHILLSDSAQFRGRGTSINKAKFADTAIPFMAREMERIGARRQHFLAKIAGGSKLFPNNNISVGEKNVEAVIRTLKEMGIAIRGQDVGGNYGRTMRLFVDSGKVLISTVGKGEKEL